MTGSITQLVRTLVEVGATPEMILAAVATAEASKDAALEASREKARARFHKWKSNKPAANVSKRSQPLANDSKQLVGAEDKSSNTQIIDKEGRKKDATNAPSDLDAFKAELSSLDAERLGAIIKLRKAKRGQLTALAAKLFIADAAAAGLSLPEAVDTCVSRNWITVKADWLAKSQPRSGAPPGRQRTYADVAMDRAKANGSASIFGNNGDVELIPPSRREPRSDDGNLRGGLGLRYAGSGG